jgi:PE-PPE domain
MPLKSIPLIGPPIAAALDPPLRVLIETGYDRTISPGQPTPGKWLYIPNLGKTAVDFVGAIPTGWDNAIAEITGNPANRPFGTTIPGPYGVGGPPVDSSAVDPYGPPTPLTLPPVQAKTTPPATAAADATNLRRRAAKAAPAATAGQSSEDRPPRHPRNARSGKPASAHSAASRAARPAA